MIVDFSDLSASQTYFTMIQTVVPRPVAWVLSDNGDDSYNLAPFSYFTAVSSRPPVLMFSAGLKPDGSDKDTRHNIQQREHFVIHIPHTLQAQQVTDSARSLAWGDSEVDALSLPMAPIEGFPLPRLADCRLAFACRRYQLVEMGDVPQLLVFGLVEKMYLADNVAEQQQGRLSVNVAALDPLARLGGDDYAGLAPAFTVARPK